MNRKWLGMVLVLAGAAAGCGQGRLIFGVDVYSFLTGEKHDTVSYYAPLPPGTPDTIPVQKVNVLPVDAGQSLVDSVNLSGTVDFVNSTGTGNIQFSIYIDTVPGVYTKPPVLSVSAAVTGTTTTPASFNTALNAAVRQFFTSKQVYVGIRAAATATSPPVQGKAHLTALHILIVMQEKIF